MNTLTEREILAKGVHQLQRTRWLLLVATFVILLIVVAKSATYGVTDITVAKLTQQLGYQLYLTNTPGLTGSDLTAFIQLRLPRIAMGIVAGMVLAISGAGMQVITGNRMASPFTTGIASAAAFGAAIGMMVPGLASTTGGVGVVVTAFTMSALCSLVVLAVSALRHMGNAAIVLAGIAISYLFSALSAGMQYVASEKQLAAIIGWTFGNLGQVGWMQIGICTAVGIVTFSYLQIKARQLTLLAAGEATARSLGVPVAAIRAQVALLVTLAAATMVAFSGVIGFVGLVAPHIAGMTIGRDLRFTIPMTALIGALLLVSADLVGRWIVSPMIVPVGIVVSLVGVPIFIWLIVRDREDRL